MTGDFTRLWTATTASLLGARIAQIGIPLLAVRGLGATPLDMGVLAAAQTVGVLLVGLPAGVVVDRVRRRPLMIAASLARVLALLTVPVALAAGWLTLGQLVAVALVMGVATVFFDLAQQAYLPALVQPDRLVDANARMQASQSAATVSGSSAGGVMVAVAGAGGTLLGSAALLLGSAATLRGMRCDPEPARSGSGNRAVLAGMVDGLRWVGRDPVLRAIACCSSWVNLWMSMLAALAVYFLTRDIGLSPGAVGLILGATGAGGLAAAATARVWTARLGSYRTIWLSLVATQPLAFLLPLTGPGWRAVLFAAGWFGLGYGGALYSVTQLSLRQVICPQGTLGRVGAAIRVLAWASVPVGGMVGGVLGTWLGARGALFAAAAGISVSALWLLRSPLTQTATAGSVR
ncbi:MFS transporter [Phytohabitans sp. LJ34]|uniref:MFS transporter n=1 Tax=Phytohabitans sp. LJ34 TaxID=3452217 RepID=UPI003F88C81F